MSGSVKRGMSLSLTSRIIIRTIIEGNVYSDNQRDDFKRKMANHVAIIKKRGCTAVNLTHLEALFSSLKKMLFFIKELLYWFLEKLCHFQRKRDGGWSSW